MNDILRKRVLNFVKEAKASIKKDNGYEYVEFPPIYNYVLHRSNASRSLSTYPGLGVKINGTSFIQIEFIPWWFANRRCTRKTDDEQIKRVADVLYGFGIPTPGFESFVYFAKLEDIGYIKIGSTVSPKTRLNMLNQVYGKCSFLGYFKTDNAYKKEEELHNRFDDLRVESEEHNELFLSEKKLIDFINTLGDFI